MKVIKNIVFLFFIALIVNACENTDNTDSTDNQLVGVWSWASSVSTLTDTEGNVVGDPESDVADSLNTWVITLNDDGTWSEARLEEGYASTDGGTWSSSDGVITITFDEEEEDHDHGDGDHDDDYDDDVPEIMYELSEDSNTLTMNASFNVDMQDEDGNVVDYIAVQQWIMDRVE